MADRYWSPAGAANIWAGTTKLTTQEAVNIKCGTTKLSVQNALRYYVE